MPRSYKKSMARQFFPENMKRATIDIVESDMSYRESAERNGVKPAVVAPSLRDPAEIKFALIYKQTLLC